MTFCGGILALIFRRSIKLLKADILYRILCPNNRLSLQLLSFRLLQSVTSMILLSSATAHQFQISYFIEIRLLLLAPSSNSAPTNFFLQRQIWKLPAKKRLWLYFVWIREKDYREKEDLYVIGELLRYTENAVSGVHRSGNEVISALWTENVNYCWNYFRELRKHRALNRVQPSIICQRDFWHASIHDIYLH